MTLPHGCEQYRKNMFSHKMVHGNKACCRMKRYMKTSQNIRKIRPEAKQKTSAAQKMEREKTHEKQTCHMLNVNAVQNDENKKTRRRTRRCQNAHTLQQK